MSVGLFSNVGGTAFFITEDVVVRYKTYLSLALLLCVCGCLMQVETHSVGGGTQDLHQHVLVGARSLHGLPQLLHCKDVRRVQHGDNGILKAPRQLAFKHVNQLLREREREREN